MASRSIPKPAVSVAAAGVYHYRRLLVAGLPDPPSPSADNSGQGWDIAWAALAGASVLLLVALIPLVFCLEMHPASSDDAEEQETSGGDGSRGMRTRRRSSSSNNVDGRGDDGGGRARRQQQHRQRQPDAAADVWEEGTCCSVCLSELADGEAVRVLTQCRHRFHAACIDKWLRDRRTCPVCRAVAATKAKGCTFMIICSAGRNTDDDNGRRGGEGRRAQAAAADVEMQQAARRAVVQPPPPPTTTTTLVCTYRAADGWDEEQTTCSVCLAELEDGEAVWLLTACMHFFHAACADPWLRRHATCPICRTPAVAAATATAAK
ncbi:hypothetical protein BS78_K267000 [Paspalum vaginatum]|uniref:RING-type domain-containing protein n=1 Tax=Paspalum vaginatum TaxID=158149 RepID=A0A9W8CE01_9POAL|nr:hypothetical protein BS78_K267000 [Paspalum vaginatum]